MPIKIIYTIIGVGVIAFGLAIIFLLRSLPSLPDNGQTAVQAIPPSVTPSARLPPYRKSHPRFITRPEEIFLFPIRLGQVGPKNPLFSGPNNYPFLCGKMITRNDQPLVDNLKGHGVPIYQRDETGKKTSKVVGYSKDCLYPTRAIYYYNRIGTEEFFPLEQSKGDIQKIIIDGRTIDFVVRLETGTINRFIYAIAALRGAGESLEQPNAVHWNRRLIYQFRGGVGIGKRQGDFKIQDIFKLRYQQLKQGYAVAYSTANQTSNHYNIWLAEDTAWRVKRQFSALYSEPLYTVGIGGSGGAIQQYLLAQNSPGLLDAAVPQYSYPDMVSQTTYVLDCELLEFYFDVTDSDNQLWKNWENRRWVEGGSANSNADNRYRLINGLLALVQGRKPVMQAGASECVNGWRGMTPLIHNPRFTFLANSFAPHLVKEVHWTHWEDLKQFYGVNEYGYANSTWDNVGVQYGLEPLRQGKIGLQTFLHLNALVGGWKAARAMVPERFGFLAGGSSLLNISFWSDQNMRRSVDGGNSPAPRTTGSLAAIEGAYRSGHVFIGLTEIPIIDIRHYLDAELNIHHSAASLSARARLQRGQGHADNQLIWVSAKPYDSTAEAFATIDRWMLNTLRNPAQSINSNKPPQAVDKCFTADGSVIAAGPSVWGGRWNGRPTGACLSVYPRHKTSREIAGGEIAGDIFKCYLQSVDSAIKQGVYGKVDMDPYREPLEAIFPEGVCDYANGDMGRPVDLVHLRPSVPRGQLTGQLKRSLPISQKQGR